MKRMGLWLVPAVVLVAGCSREKEEPAAEPQTFYEVMAKEIDPRADVIWEVGNAAIDGQSMVDPAKMSDADWTKLANGADALRESALKIATMNPIVLTRPGVKIGDEDAPGGHSSAQVQAMFDKDPQGLRDMANTLAAHSADIAAAARAKDAAAVGPLINQLDSVCESCHLTFWYPEEKAFVEEFLRQGNQQSEPRP